MELPGNCLNRLVDGKLCIMYYEVSIMGIKIMTKRNYTINVLVIIYEDMRADIYAIKKNVIETSEILDRIIAKLRYNDT